uniref:protein ENHANCED DOWNY MILDEW 2-like n=1 Tax=Erigeron canadensis TaxID=72917 RepID=UPI001CB981A9|nr:protein ENHANCED DOWNY MILDEW 2-like [Erigeron canadensis]
MAYFDGDEGALRNVVSNYYFNGADDEPVSFAPLPVKWGTYDILYHNKNLHIYLRGTTDNGLQKVHKQVKAWTFDLSKPKKPQISVLSKDNTWINLLKPRKSYVSEIRTILVTLHSLHFFKTQPKASAKPLWDHLSKVFSYYDIRPSEKDLLEHLNFIGEAVKRDITLGRSKFLASLLEESPRKKRTFDQNADGMDDDEYEYGELTTQNTEDSESDDENNDDDDDDDGYDNVCALCDNGGDLTCCEGKCFRAFHATLESAGPNCKSLGLSAEEVKGREPWLCLNCSHQQHQCFVCGNLGSSNKSSGAEVFCCSCTTCGHFYHPECVAQLLEDKSDTRAHILQKKIAAGEPFTCPAHKCHKCKEGENEKIKGLQFAICRRCPRSYHRRCLPSKILFDKKDVVARAWDGLLPKSRALIYCLKHEIDPKLRTAVSSVKFPQIFSHSKKKVALSEEVLNTDYTSNERIVKRSCPSTRPIECSRKRVTVSSGSKPVKKQRVINNSNISSKNNLIMEVERPKLDDNRSSKKDDIWGEKDGQTLKSASCERIVTLMKEAASITPDKDKLHGMGYTFFGRHFAKVEKLEEIIGRLSWYVEDGDTIVDLFCGANDFIRLMKKQLDEMGMSCSYKNYDITCPESEFYFENTDWMNALSKELPCGSRLIIGLNPPLRKSASLLNLFIDQALLIKPKLIIQFVSPGTKRLDDEDLRTPYDLVWEDAKLLAEKSVYLPGSVEVNEKQMDQWNDNPPALYLWSRPDWTGKHITVAQQHGHVSKLQEAHEKKALVDNHDLNNPLLMRSPKESSQCDNDKSLSCETPFLDIQFPHTEKKSPSSHQSQVHETRNSDMSTGHDSKLPSPVPYHSRDPETPDSGVDLMKNQAPCRSCSHHNIANRGHYIGALYMWPNVVRIPCYEREIVECHGYGREAYVGEGSNHRLDSSMRQRFVNGRGHCEAGHSAYYTLADQSSCNRSSTSVIQRYAPRLDDLNHLWMLHVHGPHMDASGYGPGPHQPFSHQKSS